MPAPSDVTIYHNPRCATSRKALELLRKRGIEPRVIEYLKTPPDAAELKRLLKMLGLKPRELLRKKEAKDAGLDKPGLSDEQIIAGMAKHPMAIERPIVVKGAKAALGRPAEAALTVL
jgi:arsenate reductase (glutaredoxin)